MTGETRRGAAASMAFSILLLGASAALVTACDGGASAVRRTAASQDETRPSDTRSGGGSSYASRDDASSGVDHRKDPAPLLDGKPIWAANRQHGAEDNARYHFKRDGQSFGASSMEDYVRTAQAFIAAPPAGAQVIERTNGDKLIYDPRGNVFAVATSDGAPRAMFKPRDGQAYWDKQKARASRQAEGRSSDGGSSDDGRQG
jgi:pyocin large subunit-like protein